MNIGIITFHNAINYGAVLQCYALKTRLEKEGHTVQIIDYDNGSSTGIKSGSLKNIAKSKFILYKDKNIIYRLFLTIGSLVKNSFNINQRKINKKKKKLFQTFRKSNFIFTKNYKSINELRLDPPLCDVYICGSDQLWNPDLSNGKYDPAYFLGFGTKSIIRISYAVSACNLDDKQDQELRNLLKNIDFISIRESKNQRKIEALSGKDITICPDPTILLKAEDYCKIEEIYDIGNKKYIFIYLLWKGNSKEICDYLIHKILETYPDITILDATPGHLFHQENIINIDLLSPGQWLYLIDNAEYVITNSFHCTCFSTIFKKQCFVLPSFPKNSERLYEYCQNIGIEDHYIQDNMGFEFPDSINYEEVYNKQCEFEKNGFDFIDKALHSQ